MKRALISLAAAAACIIAGAAVIAVTWRIGFGDGLYCSLGTASTVGCPESPPGTSGRVAAAAVMLTAIPLLADAFSHVHVHRVKRGVGAQLDERDKAVHARLDAIQRAQRPPKRRTTAKDGEGAPEAGTPGENG